MRNIPPIIPHARVRCAGAMIGTVGRLVSTSGRPEDEPDRMIVLSDDGRWQYDIPLSLVAHVSEESFPIEGMVVDLAIAADDLPRYVLGQESRDVAAAPAQPATRAAADERLTRDAEDIRVPLAREDLVARPERGEIGRVHIHKAVEAEEQHFFVPVEQERAIIERIPADQYDEHAPRDPNEMIIPLMEERLVVQKQVVVREYLRIRKEAITQDAEVRGEVRHEVAHITQEGVDGGAGHAISTSSSGVSTSQDAPPASQA